MYISGCGALCGRAPPRLSRGPCPPFAAPCGRAWPPPWNGRAGPSKRRCDGPRSPSKREGALCASRGAARSSKRRSWTAGFLSRTAVVRARTAIVGTRTRALALNARAIAFRQARLGRWTGSAGAQIVSARRGGCELANGGAGEPLDVAQVATLCATAQRDRDAISPGAGRATNAVHVALGNVRQIVVHDVADAVDVDAARSDIGRDQHLEPARAEVVQRALPRTLGFVAVNGFRDDFAALQLLHQAIGAVLGTGENNRAIDGWITQHFLEHAALVRGLDHVHGLVDALRGGRNRSHVDAHRIDQNLTRQAFDIARHGGREEQRLALLGELLQNALHVRQEAHVEHAIGLVQNQDLDLVQERGALIHQVEQTTWGGNEHVEPTAEQRDLRTLAHAAEDH